MIPVPSFECTLDGARVDCMEVSRVTLNVPNLAILSHRETSFLKLVGKWYILNCILNFSSFSGFSPLFILLHVFFSMCLFVICTGGADQRFDLYQRCVIVPEGCEIIGI